MTAPVAPIVHIEFASADFERTASFYGELFGWQTQQNATASYMKFDGGDGPSGGWVRADMVQSAGPIPYLVVADLAATVEKAEKAGGRIIARRLPFAGGGEVGLVADPDGNVIGLWMRKKGDAKAEARTDSKPEAKPEPRASKPAKAAPKIADRKPAKPAKRR